MTNQTALENFQDAIYRSEGELLLFHREIADSNLSNEEKNFWMCLCNDFEDLKFKFENKVKVYCNDVGQFNRPTFLKYFDARNVNL